MTSTFSHNFVSHNHIHRVILKIISVKCVSQTTFEPKCYTSNVEARKIYMYASRG